MNNKTVQEEAVVDEEAPVAAASSAECSALSNLPACPEFPPFRDVVLAPISERLNDAIRVLNRIPSWFNSNVMRGSTAMASRLYAMGDALSGNEGSNQFFTEEGIADIEKLKVGAPPGVIDDLLAYAAEVKKKPLETRAEFIRDTFTHKFLSRGPT